VKAFLCQARAFLVRDFATDFTYRLSFAIGFIDAIGAVGMNYLLSTLIAVRPGGYDAFAFIVTGLVLNSAMTTGLVCYAQAIRQSQQSMTLPLLVTSPIGSARLIVLSSAYPMIRGAMESVLFLGVALILGLRLAGANIVGAVLVFVLALAAFGAIGVLSAACIVVWKRGDPIPWLIGAASWLFGGVFFPVDRLPESLQVFSRLLPITYALDALRPALLGSLPLWDILTRAASLVLFTAVIVPLSLFAFDRALSRARVEGTLRQF
jgi:ABC-2 type transport system permease protein